MRVLGWQTRGRNESDPVGAYGAPSTDHVNSSKDLSMSLSVGTRKMVNYA
jgi:hypothetical protein